MRFDGFPIFSPKDEGILGGTSNSTRSEWNHHLAALASSTAPGLIKSVDLMELLGDVYWEIS